MTVNFKWKTIAFYIYSSRHAKNGFLKNNYIVSINCNHILTKEGIPRSFECAE